MLSQQERRPELYHRQQNRGVQSRTPVTKQQQQQQRATAQDYRALSFDMPTPSEKVAQTLEDLVAASIISGEDIVFPETTIPRAQSISTISEDLYTSNACPTTFRQQRFSPY